MSLSLNKPKLDNLAGNIWKSAERLRGKFKAYEYQSVILPIIVIRRLECVLLAWREAKRAEVLAKRPKLTAKELDKLVKSLETSTASFSNKTNWTLRKVYEEDHTLLAENFRKSFPLRTMPSVRRTCSIKDDRQAKVFLGNSLIPHDAHSKEPGDQLPETKFRFDFMLSNPPFGVTWGGKDGYEKEARKLEKARYQAGMPRVNDGAVVPPNHAGQDATAGEGRKPHRHHLQRLAAGGPVKLKSSRATKGSGPPPRKVSVQDVIAEIRAKFSISDEEAVYIKEVTEEKVADPEIHSTITAHREDVEYLDGAYRGQVNDGIQMAYNTRAPQRRPRPQRPGIARDSSRQRHAGNGCHDARRQVGTAH